MSQNDKKESKYSTFLKIITLIIFIFLAYLTLRSIQNIPSGSLLTTFGPTYFSMIILTFWFLLIGYIIWDLFGDQISEPFASFLLQSGEKISKPKYYSKARALLTQNKIEEAIKLYEKILNEDKFDITAYCELADIYHEKLKDYSAALNCYKKIEQYARENTDIIFAINRKADIYLLNKDYSKAVEELGEIIKKSPETKDSKRAEERIKNLQNKII
jgi:tetratricopeptide (TPR) repeat protein